MRKLGKDPVASANCKKWMEEVGFVNVTEKKWAVPINPWAKGQEQKIRGAMMMTNVLEAAQAVTMNIFTKVHGWAEQEVELFLVDVRAAMKDKKHHGYIPVLVLPFFYFCLFFPAENIIC